MGAFDRDCFSLSVAPLPDYDWGGAIGEIEITFPPGPDEPIPPPPEIYAGCPCPTVTVSNHPPGSSTGIVFSIAHPDDDCCLNDFLIDYYPPCTPSVNVAYHNRYAWNSKSGKASLTGATDGCDINIGLDVTWPCPTSFSISFRNSRTSRKDGSIRASVHNVNCNIDVDCDVEWPCPTDLRFSLSSWKSNWGGSGTWGIRQASVTSDCITNIIGDITTPCTAFSLKFSVSTAADPSITSLDRVDKDNCNAEQEFTIWFPGVKIEDDDGDDCYEKVVVGVEYVESTRTLRVKYGKPIGHWPG